MGSTIPQVLTRDPLSYREQLQMEDYAWKIKLIAADFVTREELTAWAWEAAATYGAHTHPAPGGTTSPPAGGLFPYLVDNLAIATKVIASREPWKALAAAMTPLPI